MPTYPRFLLCALLCLYLTMPVRAQNAALKDTLLSLTARSDSFNHQKPAEKIFMQIDKTYYVVSDTLWFKAYVLNAAYLNPTTKSGYLYIDIADGRNQPVKQFRFTVTNGLSWGNVNLEKTGVKPGSYTIRAYTRWLQNFGNDYYLYKHFDVVDSLGAVAQLHPAATPKTAQKKQKQARAITSPVQDIDLQFMPEGGVMVAGMHNVVAFKAIGTDGLSRQISATIFNRAGRPTAQLNTNNRGMGRFSLLPQLGETYFARVVMPDSSIKDYPVPPAKPSGTILSVSGDSSDVTVITYASKDIADANKNYFLVGKARGIVCYAAVISFKGTNRVFSKISNRLFPTGITHFSLLDTAGRAVNERLLFIAHNDRLNAELSADKPTYKKRDSVALQLKVTANNFDPVAGNFSVSVTDDSQVAQDTTRYEDFATRMLITADLKGNIENPGYYFRNVGAQTRYDLDNLLLTQGWIGYNWQQELAPAATPFAAEPSFTISGRVLNVFGKPLQKPGITLLSRKPMLVSETTGDKNGRFTFTGLPLTDTAIYILQAKNKRGRAFNVDLKVDEVQTPLFDSPLPTRHDSVDTIAEPIMANFAQKQQQNQLQKDEAAGISHRIAEVKIVAKRIVKGSANINGAGNADIIIDEKELEKAGKKTFLDVLTEKVPGFREGYLQVGAKWPPEVIEFEAQIKGTIDNSAWYMIKGKTVILFIDGIELRTLISPFRFTDFKEYLTTNSAENIKGIEINMTPAYNSTYLQRWAPNIPANESVFRDFAFIEITTRSGSGPNIQNSIGNYMHKPMPLTYPALFYTPKYTGKQTSITHPDLRSTIHWQPNVVTDKDGKATISFFTSDIPGTYTIILEGTDLNGSFGSAVTKIKVE